MELQADSKDPGVRHRRRQSLRRISPLHDDARRRQPRRGAAAPVPLPLEGQGVRPVPQGGPGCRRQTYQQRATVTGAGPAASGTQHNGRKRDNDATATKTPVGCYKDESGKFKCKNCDKVSTKDSNGVWHSSSNCRSGTAGAASSSPAARGGGGVPPGGFTSAKRQATTRIADTVGMASQAANEDSLIMEAAVLAYERNQTSFVHDGSVFSLAPDGAVDYLGAVKSLKP
uniref:Uncharacterized protein n=1 Tax=Hemiselmis tepida TaxID=464990 RepID=A0A7S0W1E0_9CRYP|mmetsp:Transcript_31618/g.80493  ORF Transcript_31618/g.80493 Transcript_31618/m.80493 type:complete len:229 (+) Transcript_31618:202-888(+)